MTSNQLSIRLPPDFDERYPGASANATEAAMNLARAGDLLVRRIAELVEPFDLSPSSALALAALADSTAPLPPSEIAERLILSRASVTSLLDSLEKSGYVRRTAHPTDRRMILIELTDSGRRIAHEFRLVVHRKQKEWMGILSENERRQLTDMLHRLQTSLANEET
jgi:DNA-binding MarR family transcriptional regulator